MEKIPAHIRIYFEIDGMLVDQQYDIDIDSELGGMVPNVGDRIVYPGVSQGLDRYDPHNREVYEVTQRYFLLGNPAYKQGERDIQESPAWLVLVVQPRQGREEERSLFHAAG